MSITYVTWYDTKMLIPNHGEYSSNFSVTRHDTKMLVLIHGDYTSNFSKTRHDTKMLIPTWSWHTLFRVAEGNIFQHSKGHSIWKLGTEPIIPYLPDSANSHSSVFISKQ